VVRVTRGLARAAELIACALFASVFAVFVYKIVMRYAAHDPIAWADEVSVILFVWVIFWANAFVVGDRQQITFDLVYQLLPQRAKRAAAMARLLLIGGLFAAALPGVVDYILFLWRERTPVLGLRLDLVYACFGLFVAAVGVRAAAGLAGLIGARWREHL
jgi:TRAP-type C4-dicarboxylate transport system permease small subunit